MGPIALLSGFLAVVHWFLFIGYIFLFFVCLVVIIVGEVVISAVVATLVLLIPSTLVLLIIEKLVFKNTHILPWKVEFNNYSLEDTVDGATSRVLHKVFGPFFKLLGKVFGPIFEGIFGFLDKLFDKIGDGFEKLGGFIVILLIGIPAIGIPVLSYPLAIYRWFATDHQAFWHGFKELLWVPIPIVNIFYVWDIWWDIITAVISFFWTLGSLISDMHFYI